jgi:class 3 adenylate cyclase/tetratricopeptide (TPR) repeat protein
MPINRKLVDVVMADVVGYSRLMERDESGTHRRLRALNDDLFAPKIAEHGGRTVKTAGDGMLLEFPSATSALRCAVEIQREMGVRNLYVAADDRIELRIGINLGDIIVDGDDIIGDGVNVAARLETLAAPGGISVASAVWEQVHEDLGVEFIDAGQQHVKNISKPIRVYRVALGKGVTRTPVTDRSATQRRFTSRPMAIAAATIAVIAIGGFAAWQWPLRSSPTAPAFIASPPPRSIIVLLPFGAPASEADLVPLAESLGGDVASALANSVRDATITPYTVPGKRAPVDPSALGRQLNGRYLLAGDVRAAGDDIAATVRLTDTMTAKELASERRTIARVRGTDDRDLLVARVTAAARLMFLNAEGKRLRAEPLRETDANALVARADAIFTGEDIESTRAARKLYAEARERDPSLIAAWVGHLYTLEAEFELDFRNPRNEALLQEMDNESRRMVAIDSRDARSWYARALTLAFLGRFDAAFEANDRARAIDPSRFSAQRTWLYIMSGQSAKALEEISRGDTQSADRDSGLFMACHANIHLAHYAEAIADCERAVGGTDDYWVYLDLATAYAQTGDLPRAQAAKAELLKRVPDFTISRLDAKRFSPHPVWIEEIRDHFYPGLRKAGVSE